MKVNDFKHSVEGADSSSSTSQTTSSYWPPNLYNAERGWECPRCGRINAPWVRQCDCSRDKWTISWTSDHIEPSWTGDKPDWWKEVTCDPDTFKVHPDTVTWEVPSSICQSDSSTTKSNPNSTIYVTGHNPVVGGSDYYNPVTGTYDNVAKNLRNSVTDGKHYQGTTYTCEKIKE